MKKRKVIPSRSPDYPGIDLEQAISYAEKFYKQRGTELITFDEAFMPIGLSSKSGKARSILAALVQFGLLEKKERKYFVTDRATKIITMKDEDGPELKELIRSVALNPSIFTELLLVWRKNPSEEGIQDYLQKKHFTSRGIEICTNAFIGTLEYAEILNKQDLIADLARQSSRVSNLGNGQNSQSENGEGHDGPNPCFSVDLPDGNVLVIQMKSKVSSKVFDEYVMKLVEISRYRFVDNWEG